MAKQDSAPRFGPEVWVKIRDTGAHVKIESWSAIAAAYRVRSKQGGLQFLTEAELDEVPLHPSAHLGKYWSRCKAAGCGAPLTQDLPICPRCNEPTCSCGRCACGTRSATAGAAATRTRAPRKKAAPRPG